MTSPISGRCACGAVHYEADAAPAFSMQCHCRDCQRATGTGHASMAIFPRTSFRLHGEVKYHSVTTDMGHLARRGFCPQCGSPVVGEPGAVPHMIAVHAASLDDPSVFTPSAVLYTKRAHPWDVTSAELPKFEAMMPPPPGAN
jgi:hypothetical protein